MGHKVLTDTSVVFSNQRKSRYGMSTTRTVRERFGAKREWEVGPGANLAGANFRSVDLRGLNLTGCDLTDAIFNEADLTGACLDNATLCNAVLFRTILSGVTAHGANFAGAILREAILSGADFSAATLGPGACDEALGDEATQLPEGHSCLLGEYGDDDQLGNPKLGGYRRLPMMLDEKSSPQPFLKPGSQPITTITEGLQADLRAAVVRVLNETLQMNDFKAEELFEPDRVDDWYIGRVTQRDGSGNPYVVEPLARYIAAVFNFEFQSVHTDGSATALLRPHADATDTLIREVLAPNFLEIAIGFDEPETEELDETFASVAEICERFDQFVSNGFARYTVTRIRMKRGRQKLLVLSLDQTEGDTVHLDVEATEFGEQIAAHIWAAIEEEGVNPATINVAEEGWSTEFDLEPTEDPVVDEEAVQMVRELYSPVSIAGCGEVLAFERWENDLTMARVRLWEHASQAGWPASSQLEPSDALRAVLDNVVSAYLCTKTIESDQIFEFIYGEDEVSAEDEIEDLDDIEEDEGDGDEEDDAIDEKEAHEVERDELNALVAAMHAAGTRVEGLWCRAGDDMTWGSLLPEDLIAESRWGYMAEAARNRQLFIRSRPELFEALGITEAEQIDSRTFRVRMKPRVQVRFHRNYEWVPPSDWNLEELVEDQTA